MHVANDIVVRGCLNEHNAQINENCENNKDICEKCSGDASCNSEIVDGEFCIHCDSENDPNCRQNLNHTMNVQCKLSVSRMGCYLYNDGG